MSHILNAFPPFSPICYANLPCPQPFRQKQIPSNQLTKKGGSLYVKFIPRQWCLNNVPIGCIYESWIERQDNTVQVRSRLVNTRADKTQYPRRLQVLPAV